MRSTERFTEGHPILEAKAAYIRFRVNWATRKSVSMEIGTSKVLKGNNKRFEAIKTVSADNTTTYFFRRALTLVFFGDTVNVVKDNFSKLNGETVFQGRTYQRTSARNYRTPRFA